MTINIKKTQYMIVSGHHKKYDNISLRINNGSITRTMAYKYLGVKLDQHLKFTRHINVIAGTVNNKIRSIIRVSHFLPKRITLMLYKTLILPHFDYASIIWGSACETITSNYTN